jgi:hypothetical protein
MSPPSLLPISSEQIQVAESLPDHRIFLSGIAGTGKTNAGLGRLLWLLNQGIPGEQILILTPQRTLATPYLEAAATSPVSTAPLVTNLTIGGLSRRMIDLFWPLVSDAASFAQPDMPPVFLTLETSQYYIARLVYPLLDQGYFSAVSMERSRLLSQVIDNLNKSALVGFPLTDIAHRLKSAWTGASSQYRIYDDAQACALLFRNFCLAHNLLDFSLQVELFKNHLWPLPACRTYLLQNYRHLIVDNLEEDTPTSHDILRDWLPEAKSALLIFDDGAGFRRFLGADPQSAQTLNQQCEASFHFTDIFSMGDETQTLCIFLSNNLKQEKSPPHTLLDQTLAKVLIPASVSFQSVKYFPQMLDWVAQTIADLVHNQGVPPSEIAVLSPFLSDALRYSLSNRLNTYGVPNRSHRPSRSLRAEPVSHCLITLALLAHPVWLSLAPNLTPDRFDLAYALIQTIAGLDLPRAQLLVEIVFRLKDGYPQLSSFDLINSAMQERITYRFGSAYERLRLWLSAYQSAEPVELDQFLSRLFGEVLSQPSFGFHSNYTAGEITANLIESIQKFRWARLAPPGDPTLPLGVDFLEMVKDGVISSLYIRSWQAQPEEAVLLAPAYTFLMTNQPVDYQFWLDIGNRSWSERLYQPLTHPYVLSRNWSPGRPWMDADEVQASLEALEHLTAGLLRRCRRHLFLGLSDLNEQGFEQRGLLLSAFQRVLKDAQV